MKGLEVDRFDESDFASNPFLFGVDRISIEEKLKHGYIALFTEILQSSGNNVLSW